MDFRVKSSGRRSQATKYDHKSPRWVSRSIEPAVGGSRAAGVLTIYFTRQLMTSVQYTQRVTLEQTVTFEREAIPWIDDVYRFALSLTRDESDADDVVQDTFLRAFRSWHTYLPGSDCRRWLFTICRNVFLRSRERARPTVELDASEVDSLAVDSVHASNVRDGYADAFARLDLAPA